MHTAVTGTTCSKLMLVYCKDWVKVIINYVPVNNQCPYKWLYWKCYFSSWVYFIANKAFLWAYMLCFFFFFFFFTAIFRNRRTLLKSKATTKYVFRCRQTSKWTKRTSKGHVCQLWLVDFDPFCLFLFFKVLSLSPWLWLMAAKNVLRSN